MSAFSPKATFSVLIFICLIIFGMYLMKEVFHIESYREDHHIGSEPHEESGTEEMNTHGTPTNDDKIESNDSLTAPDHSQMDTIATVLDSAVIADETTSFTKQEEKSKPTVEDYFETLLREYKSNILANLPETENRTDLVVRYYQHDSDQDRVNILTEYGYYIHERPVKNNYEAYQSNSIFFGDSVSTQDIQVIAYLLITQEIPIRQIIPSKFHDGWKANAIEIGTDINIQDKPLMTLESVRAFENPYFGQ